MALELTDDKLGYRIGDVLVALKEGTTGTPQAVKSVEGRLQIVPYLWNPNTLAYEVTTGGATPGTNVTVTNFPALQAVSASSLPLPSGAATEATLQDVLAALGGAATISRYDEGATYTYLGKATPGSAEGSAVWQIKRLTNASLAIDWADANDNFDNVWTNRASLSYS